MFSRVFIFLALVVCCTLAAPWSPWWGNSIRDKGYTDAKTKNDAKSGVGPDGMLFATADSNAQAKIMGMNGQGLNFGLSKATSGANVFKG